MNTENDDLDLIFDDDECIEFIYSWLADEDRQRLTKDDIQTVLDAIYDFYESEGLVQEDTAEEASIDEQKMYDFILAELKEQQTELAGDLVQLILAGEYEYGVEKGIYQDDEE